MDQQALLSTAFKMTVGLGVVLLFFGAALFIARRFAGSSKNFLKRGLRTSVRPMEVLAHQSLGPGKSLYLVRCLGKRVLVGATNAQLSHIADIEEIDEELATLNAVPEQKVGFESSLQEKIDSEAPRRVKDRVDQGLRDIARI